MTVATAEARQRAQARCAHLPGPKQAAFLLAFNAGLKAEWAGQDTARFVRALIAAGKAASVAGFLEGVAAARFVPPLEPGHSVSWKCGCRDCRTVINERQRRWYHQRKQRAGAS